MSGTINGRTAVITGAGSGIGRAVAQRLAAHGCPVVLADWNEEGLEDTAASIAGPVLAKKLDVRDRQGQLAFAAEVKEWAPSPVGLVFNNAGVTVLQGVADPRTTSGSSTSTSTASSTASPRSCRSCSNSAPA
jgi:NADP-dependent 3-hydroxy acid dehydrogenase YdfG